MRRALARVAEPQRISPDPKDRPEGVGYEGCEPVGGWRSQPPREDEAVC